MVKKKKIHGPIIDRKVIMEQSVTLNWVRDKNYSNIIFGVRKIIVQIPCNSKAKYVHNDDIPAYNA